MKSFRLPKFLAYSTDSGRESSEASAAYEELTT
jgi:hypothetical protein